VGEVTEATCLRCHDAANSPQFDYEKYLKRTSCVLVSQQERERAAGAGGGGEVEKGITPPGTP
jgi:hypothetical protein